MMRSFAIVMLLAAQVSAECNHVQSFGSSAGSLETVNEVNFYVEAGAATTCTVTCDSGSNTRLLLRYDAEPSGLINDADESVDGCDITASAVTSDRSTTLGIRVESENFENLAMSCGCTATYDPTGSGIECFSGSTKVQVQDKGEVWMKDLQVGDMVLTGKNTFEPVYAFGHRHEDSEGHFYQIYTDDSDSPLEMTGAHLVFVDKQAIRADRVKVGDQLVKGSGEVISVTKISTVTKTGLFMPLTADGTIVVEGGIIASTYVSIQADAPTILARIATFFGLTEHDLSHWWLSPLRMMCMGVSSKYCESAHDEEGILNWLMAGRGLAKFAEPLNIGISMILMGVPMFLVFAGLNVIESLLGGPARAPLLAAAIGLGVACRMSSHRSMQAMTKKTD